VDVEASRLALLFILFEDVIARIKEEGGEVGFRNGNYAKAD